MEFSLVLPKMAFLIYITQIFSAFFIIFYRIIINIISQSFLLYFHIQVYLKKRNKTATKNHPSGTVHKGVSELSSPGGESVYLIVVNR